MRTSRPAAKGMSAAALAGGLYVLSSFGLAVSGAVPLAPVVFGVSPDNYYFWQMLLILPGTLLAWLLTAALVRQFAQGRKGSFRTAAVLTGPALAAPLFLCWIPQGIQSFLMILGMGQEEFVGLVSVPGVWQTLYLGFHVAGLALAIMLLAAASIILRPERALRAWLSGLSTALILAMIHVFLVR